MIYHVSKNGSDFNCGSENKPFLTIGKAASIMTAGDTCFVHEGVYREWVKPRFGGTSDSNRISYIASQGEQVVITGSEIVTDWVKVDSTVYKTVIDNSIFGGFNPYSEELFGDWFVFPKDYKVHTGDVYINGKSAYEASSMEQLYSDEIHEYGFKTWIFPEAYKRPNPEDTLYRWYAIVNEKTTEIYVNFREINPEDASIEINVRKCCFFPETTGINYITVKGFELCNAATPFAPPTATQYGLIGPNWAKGWVIEDNNIHDSKCSGISIGNYTSKSNLSTLLMNKSGHQYQIEATFDALKNGWSKDNIGSHTIRNNIIHDCGQAGIVGNLGGVFSKISHNHIYDIGVKQEFWGHEIGGIKLHAAIDVLIENNHIHDIACRALWLDWQAQGTRITKNLLHDNKLDLFIEVTHGPCTVDNNFFLSDMSFVNQAQGTAIINNVFAGYAVPYIKTSRATPYHYQHSTLVQGFTVVHGGDDRVYNNIYLGTYKGELFSPVKEFNSFYDSNTKAEDYLKTIKSTNCELRYEAFMNTPQPIYIDTNVYAAKSKACKYENSMAVDSIPLFEIFYENGKAVLTYEMPDEVCNFICTTITTNQLGIPRISNLPYDNPDGSDIDFTKDYFGQTRKVFKPGPFAQFKCGKNTVIIWE